ncbi:LOW QUALITY PROTEIN: hypothetical protein TorRG33x02_211990 [Trema orientale]|uniref:Uncharacterized protein n=1 Tax=Trema orientale TaxID=63057 RepID=A0A2P5EBS9_TREOI|nr:LOW QUALITY PROTEIN: hypothetical protein TorRG33x02_211990 [Trema orientale]
MVVAAPVTKSPECRPCGQPSMDSSIVSTPSSFTTVLMSSHGRFEMLWQRLLMDGMCLEMHNEIGRETYLVTGQL